MAGMHDKDIYKRPYIRPNEKWVCGRAADGQPCSQGPGRGGKCHGGYECAPARVGDRWVCTRPDQYGGKCDDPSLPEPSFGPHLINGVGVCCRKIHCVPVRSLRARRGLISVVLCTAIAGLILIGAGGAWRDSFLSPGPLTAAHQGASMASLEEMAHGKMQGAGTASSSEGCQICHAAAAGGLSGLLKSSLLHTEETPQSQQCLVCHTEDLGNDAMTAHALAPEEIARHTQEAEADPARAWRPLSLALASLSPGVKTGADGTLACASCHQEHNGALFDLKRLDNQQCQTCHVKQFTSLGNGHPEFSMLASEKGYDYPYRRRTRIVYDHAKHETDYFQREENAGHTPANCLSCHQIGDGTFNTTLKPFEQMCAACHTGNIVAGRDEWIHVFGFPSMDFDAYEVVEEEGDVTNLPRTAEKRLSPFMMLLLSGLYADDPEAREALVADLDIVNEFNGDLAGIVFDKDPKVVGRLFSGLNTVFAALNEDQGGLQGGARSALGQLLGHEPDPGQFDAMFGFPKRGDTPAKLADDLTRRDVVEMSGWLVKESGYRVDGGAWKAALATLAPYAALAALDDPGDYAPALEFLSTFNDFRDWFNENLSIKNGAWVSKESGEEISAEDWTALIEAATGLGAAEAPESEEAPDAPAGDAPAADAAPDEAAPEAAPAEGEAAAPAREAGETFLAWLGNLSEVQDWFAETVNAEGENWTLRAPRSIYYRPVRHADPFLTAWLNFTADLYGTSPAATMLFDELSGRREGLAIGACMKCHSIDVESGPTGEQVVRVNWMGKQPQREFTKFNHTPHLKLMDCAQCHRASWISESSDRVQVAKAASAEEEAAAPEPPAEVAADPAPSAAEAPAQPATDMAYIDSFKAKKGDLEIGVKFTNQDHAPGEFAFVSNFEPVMKSDCARCHVPGKAGDSCLTCHNYHIEKGNWPAGVKSLTELLAAQKPAAPEAAPEEAEATPEAAAEPAPAEAAESTEPAEEAPPAQPESEPTESAQ
jgi:hypothetical protein